MNKVHIRLQPFGVIHVFPMLKVICVFADKVHNFETKYSGDVIALKYGPTLLTVLQSKHYPP